MPTETNESTPNNPRRRALALAAASAVALAIPASGAPQLIDREATAQTQALYRSLGELSATKTLFGHQASLAYGVHWSREEGRSDVKDVTGSHPAVYGWDLGGFEADDGLPLENYHYKYTREDLLRWTREAIQRGAVVTYAWHMINPVTGGSFYDKTPAVHAIIPGGELHEDYKRTLDKAAAFFAEISPMPIIFRPFHEHNGDWFWWGKGFASEEDYIALWRFTVDYLKDEKRIHNLIYAFSPDRSRMDLEQGASAYHHAYPGDEYVDIVGLDNYWDVGHPANENTAEANAANFARSLELIAEIAREKNKVAALTETGADTLPNPTWWTDVLLEGIRSVEDGGIAYVQVWRNATLELEGKEHFYVPYSGHPSAPDFIRFMEDESILFENELPPLYGATEVEGSDKQPAPKSE